MAKELQTNTHVDPEHNDFSYRAPHLIPKVQSKIQPKVYSRIQPKLLTNLGKEKEQKTETTSSGKLPEEVQTKMESCFNKNFSAVTIYPNSSSAQDINARAYTKDRDIHFAPGEYNPSSLQGQELIGHELAHVVQQGNGKVRQGEIHGKGLEINTESSLEKEADEAGKLASEGKNTHISGIGAGIQRKEEDIVVSSSITFMNKLFSGISAAVGLDSENNTADVTSLASALKALKYDVSDDSITNGISDEKLVTTIKKFQKTHSFSQSGVISPGSPAAFKLFPYNSKLNNVYGGRDGKWKSYLKDQKLTDTVGADGKIPSTNKAEDVKKVTTYLKSISTEEFNVELTEVSLTKGTCDKELISAIKKFQSEKCGNKQPDGIISPSGSTAKAMGLYSEYSLAGRTIRTYTNEGKISYSSKGLIEDEAYNKRQDFIINAIGIKEDSDERSALTIARKTANDSSFFTEYTENVSSKLSITAQDRAENGKQLSALLEDRVKRFHKFLVASGMYSGSMLVTSGVRAPSVAHLWSTEHFLLHKSAKQTEIENNLIKMHNESPSADVISDKDGNAWAKKEHFTFDPKDKDQLKATKVDFTKVKEYVLTFDRGRKDKTSAAAEGYRPGTKERLPNTDLTGTSLHLTGDAIDVNSSPYMNRNDAMVDLIALEFGLIRAADKEQWHLECTDKRISTSEQEIIDKESR